MIFLIPAIEWGPGTPINGARTLGSAILTLDDTSILSPGMFAYGNGVPVRTKILTVDSPTQVTLDKNLESTAASDTYSFYNRYEFTAPATDDDGEQTEADQKTTESLSGKRQTQTNFVEKIRPLKFGHVTKDDKELLENSFFTNWAIYGKTFRYFQNFDLPDFVVYENDNKSFKTKRQVKKYPDFLYEIQFKFRRLQS